MKKGLEWRWAKVLIEIFESSRNILHKDPCFILALIVLKIVHNVLMMNFAQNGNFRFRLLLIFFAEMYLLDSR
jgi:hypothetical protein